MFPGDALATRQKGYTFKPWYRGLRDPFSDMCRAGVAINDGNSGLDVQLWKARLYADGKITVAAEDSLYEIETLLTTVPGAEFVSLAFDNNMQPMVCYLRSNTANLYWYDTTLNKYVTLPVFNVRSPFIRIDDIRSTALTARDATFAYIRNDNDKLCTRILRDRFTIEHEWDTVDPRQSIYQCGLTEALRFQFHLVWDEKSLRPC